MKNTLVAIRLVVLVLSFAGIANAYTAEVNLFNLGCPAKFDDDSQGWTTNLDLGVTFTEINRVYIDWSGEIKGGLVALNGNLNDTHPVSLGIMAYFDIPIDAYAESWGGGLHIRFPNRSIVNQIFNYFGLDHGLDYWMDVLQSSSIEII
jgi:hypothetical protein